MVAEAEKTGAYQPGGLWGDIDMTSAFSLGAQQYDGGISVGVFTTGHVKPGALENVIPHMKSGAVIVFSARVKYAVDQGLDQYL